MHPRHCCFTFTSGTSSGASCFSSFWTSLVFVLGGCGLGSFGGLLAAGLAAQSDKPKKINTSCCCCGASWPWLLCCCSPSSKFWQAEKKNTATVPASAQGILFLLSSPQSSGKVLLEELWQVASMHCPKKHEQWLGCVPNLSAGPAEGLVQLEGAGFPPGGLR